MRPRLEHVYRALRAAHSFGNLGSSYHWSEQFQDGIQPTTPPAQFDPVVLAGILVTAPIWNYDNFEDGFGLSPFLYYNIATDLNSRLTFNNNTVQFNGQPNQTFDFGPNAKLVYSIVRYSGVFEEIESILTR